MRDRHDQRGFTLVELIVAMSVFMIFLSVFITGVVKLTRTTYAAADRAESASTITNLYQALDPSLRYAQDINQPGAGAGGVVYVEAFKGVDASADGRNHCTQIRYDPNPPEGGSAADGGTIAVRTWAWTPTSNTDVHRGPSSASWQTKATGVVRPDGADTAWPFHVTRATAGTPYMSLTLSVRVGSAGYAATSEATDTFIARNSSVDSLTSTGGSVCNGTGYRG